MRNACHTAHLYAHIERISGRMKGVRWVASHNYDRDWSQGGCFFTDLTSATIYFRHRKLVCVYATLVSIATFFLFGWSAFGKEPRGVCHKSGASAAQIASEFIEHYCASSYISEFFQSAGTKTEMNIVGPTSRKNKFRSKANGSNIDISFEHNEPVREFDLDRVSWKFIDGHFRSIAAIPELACIANVHRDKLGESLDDPDDYGGFVRKYRNLGYDPEKMNFIAHEHKSKATLVVNTRNGYATEIFFTCFAAE